MDRLKKEHVSISWLKALLTVMRIIPHYSSAYCSLCGGYTIFFCPSIESHFLAESPRSICCLHRYCICCAQNITLLKERRPAHTTTITSVGSIQSASDFSAHSAAHTADFHDASTAWDPHDTTKWYRASPEHRGRVGFITSMSR
jgi:hypothetical protein